MFPVEVCYLKEPCVDYTEAAIQTVFDIHMKVGLLVGFKISLIAIRSLLGTFWFS